MKMRPWVFWEALWNATMEHASDLVFHFFGLAYPFGSHLAAQWDPGGTSNSSFWAPNQHKWFRKGVPERNGNRVENGAEKRCPNGWILAQERPKSVQAPHKSAQKGSKGAQNIPSASRYIECSICVGGGQPLLKSA